MKKISLIIFVVFFSCSFTQLSFSQPLRIDIVLDLTPATSNYEDKEFASLSWVEYDIVRPGEMFLGPDRKPGTSDDFLYDPNEPSVDEGDLGWEFDLLHVSSNIAADNYDFNQVYQGLAGNDIWGLSDWYVNGLIWNVSDTTGNHTYRWGFYSFETYHGSIPIGSWLFFPPRFYGYVVVSSSIRPNYSPIPEPTTTLLLILGLAVFSRVNRGRQTFKQETEHGFHA